MFCTSFVGAQSSGEVLVGSSSTTQSPADGWKASAVPLSFSRTSFSGHLLGGEPFVARDVLEAQEANSLCVCANEGITALMEFLRPDWHWSLASVAVLVCVTFFPPSPAQFS